jgi:hypothetical protein
MIVHRVVLAVLLVVLACGTAPAVQAQEAPALTACESWVAGIPGQLPPDVRSGYLSSWFSLTAEGLGLPEGCERPFLPPETPWCFDDWSRSWGIDSLTIVHMESASMRWFCFWMEPPVTLSPPDEEPFSSPPCPYPDWHCVYPPV